MSRSYPTSTTSTTAARARRTPVQTGALAVGAVFLIVGILGFIPGVTTDYDKLELYGHDSQAMLLGIFQVSVLHNLVHLAFGAAGVIAARTASASRGFLIGGGIIYLLLWVYGLLIAEDSTVNFVPLNDADDWLHLVLAAGMIALGVLLPRTLEPVQPRRWQ